jgi:signal transduction histidine kinase
MGWKRVLRANYAQLLFVCGAFFLMILIGCFSVSRTIKKNIERTVTIALNETGKSIHAYLREPRIAFDNIYASVLGMLDRGDSQKAVLAYLKQTLTILQQKKDGISGVYSIYGYIRDEFLDTLGLDLGPDYIPQQRPWYRQAISKTTAEYTTPYVDKNTGRMIISLARALYGEKGKYYGVLTMDVGLSWLEDYSRLLPFVEGGYGIIVNQDMRVIVHPRREQYQNAPLRELGDAYAEISDMLANKGEISNKEIQDIDNTATITFFREVFNGWHVGVFIPKSSYYHELYFSAAVLIAVGSILMLSLCVILVRLSAAKMKSEEESKAKTSFLARISHEIRTPMNAIAGMSELLVRLGEKMPPQGRNYAYNVKQASANLLSIINDILDFARMESGNVEIVPVKYPLASLINDVVNMFRIRLREKAVAFLVRVDADLPGSLVGDVVKVRQILVNLLSNAVKYTDEGFVSIAVSGTTAVTDNTLALTINITDTGRGIKPQDMERLFGDFVRFDLAANNQVEGVGLGLAITKNLCRIMDGDITATSTYGQGSVFSVTLPQQVATSDVFAKIDNPEKKSVLVYELAPMYAQSVTEALNNLGVRYRLVKERGHFFAALPEALYSHALMPGALLESLRDFLKQHNVKARIGIPTEDIRGSGTENIRYLFMPVYSLSLAAFLNNTAPESVDFDATIQAGQSFVAPKPGFWLWTIFRPTLLWPKVCFSPTPCGWIFARAAVRPSPGSNKMNTTWFSWIT